MHIFERRLVTAARMMEGKLRDKWFSMRFTFTTNDEFSQTTAVSEKDKHDSVKGKSLTKKFENYCGNCRFESFQVPFQRGNVVEF